MQDRVLETQSQHSPGSQQTDHFPYGGLGIGPEINRIDATDFGEHFLRKRYIIIAALVYYNSVFFDVLSVSPSGNRHHGIRKIDSRNDTTVHLPGNFINQCSRRVHRFYGF